MLIDTNYLHHPDLLQTLVDNDHIDLNLNKIYGHFYLQMLRSDLASLMVAATDISLNQMPYKFVVATALTSKVHD